MIKWVWTPADRINAGNELSKGSRRTPGPVHETEATRVKVATGWHARKAADVMLVEHDGALGETVKVRGVHTVCTVTAEGGAVQRVKKDKNRVHYDA